MENKKETVREWAEKLREEGVDVTLVEEDPEVTTAAFIDKAE